VHPSGKVRGEQFFACDEVSSALFSLAVTLFSERSRQPSASAGAEKVHEARALFDRQHPYHRRQQQQGGPFLPFYLGEMKWR
jgi:hypothetical protein